MSNKISEFHIRLRCDVCNNMHLSNLNIQNVFLTNILKFKYVKNILLGTNPRFKNSHYSSNIKHIKNRRWPTVIVAMKYIISSI